MGYYPIFLELNVRSCIVIGGGCIGERKADELLEVGVDGAVISPTISERLRDLLAKDSITSPGTGLPSSRLIAETPVAIVRWGTTQAQETVTGCLADIAGKAGHLKPPGAIIVGKVVGRQTRLNWILPLRDFVQKAQ